MGEVRSLLRMARVHADIVRDLKDSPQDLRRYLQFHKRAVGAGMHLKGNQNLLKMIYSALDDLEGMGTEELTEEIELFLEIQAAGSSMGYLANQRMETARRVEEESRLAIKRAQEDIQQALLAQQTAQQVEARYHAAVEPKLAQLEAERLEQGRLIRAEYQPTLDQLRREIDKLGVTKRLQQVSLGSMHAQGNCIVARSLHAFRALWLLIDQTLSQLEPVRTKGGFVFSALERKRRKEKNHSETESFSMTVYRLAPDGRVHRLYFCLGERTEKWGQEQALEKARQLIQEKADLFTTTTLLKHWNRVGKLLGMTAKPVIITMDESWLDCYFKHATRLYRQIVVAEVIGRFSRKKNLEVTPEGVIVIKTAACGREHIKLLEFSSEIHPPMVWD